MIIWAVANQKGGVGKTTTAVSLAALLAARGARCLLVDLDPHGSLTSYFGFDPDTEPDGVDRLFERGAGVARTPFSALLRPSGVAGLALLPAAASLATVERRFVAHDGMGLVLRRGLAQGIARFDYALIDCPPVFGLLMLNALAACHTLIIPVQTEFLAIKGLDRMLYTLKMVERGGHRHLDHLIVPTLFDQRTRAGTQALAALRKTYAEHLWSGAIPIDTRFRDASSRGVPLPTCAPRARGTQAYALLLGYLQARSVAAEVSAGVPECGPQVDRGQVSVQRPGA